MKKKDKSFFIELSPLFIRLIEIIERLRSPEGCPWDRKQTPDSLKKYLLEEAYEVLEAIEEGNPQEICEEIGDLLFLLLFLIHIYQEKKVFSYKDVFNLCAEKMVRRHPHVFGKRASLKAEEVIAQWQKIKEKEAQEKNEDRSAILGNLPKSLPALQKAFRLGERASRVGFDWPDYQEILSKMEEEWQEMKEALLSSDELYIKEELGDLFFTMANLSRKLGFNPEEVLREATEKFRQRFIKMERYFKAQGKNLRDLSLAEMDFIWEKIKKEGSSDPN